jgi:hypothetical protein
MLDSSKIYTQECLMKLSDLFEQRRVDVGEFFNEVSRGQLKIDVNGFEDAIKKKFGRAMQEREIMGAFNQIDFESQGFIEKNNFIYSLKAYMSKAKHAISDSRYAPDDKKLQTATHGPMRPLTPDKHNRDFTDSKKMGESSLR